jgi:hypothetical protein
MVMTKTGSGIVRVGYGDTVAGIILCAACAAITDPSTLRGMETLYSPDVNEDTPACFSCDKRLDA